MTGRRRVGRQPCELIGKIFVPRRRDPIHGVIVDISTLGAFIRIDESESVPANFDLTIGHSSLPRACRIARRETSGVGVEYLEPVRHEIEEIITEHALKEELLFEALSLSLDGEATATKLRLRRTVDALMELIENRNAMNWQHILPKQAAS